MVEKLCDSRTTTTPTVPKASFLPTESWQKQLLLVENARKFRESVPNQIVIFGEPCPQAGVPENVLFFKIKRVYRAGRGVH